MLRKLLFLTCVVGLFSLAGLTVPSAMAQSTIQGTVTDSLSGNTLAGTSIFVVGTQHGTATDANGHYKITGLSPGTYSIRVSFLGYQTKTRTVTVGSGTTTLNFELVSSISKLNNIVVTAFGLKESNRSLTYSTTHLDSSELHTAGAISPVAQLVGKVSGLRIHRTSSGGYARPHLDIDLRGQRSLTRSSDPLIVIDGVKASTNALAALNSASIKSYNVLKGASGAAIYGSDAVNGVIIVTTKNGHPGGEFTVGYKTSMTWKTIAFMPDHQTKFGSGLGGGYVPFENTNWGPRFDGQVRRVGELFHKYMANYPITAQHLPYKYSVDAWKKWYQVANSLQNTLYLSGGGDHGSFYMAAGYDRNTSLIPDDKFRRFTFTANAKQQFKEITLSVHANYMSNRGQSTGAGIGFLLQNTPLQYPVYKYTDISDPLSYANPNNYFNRYYANPSSALHFNRNRNWGHRLRGNLSAKWNILDNISITATLGINGVWNSYKGHTAAFHFLPVQPFQYGKDLAASVTVTSNKGTTTHANLIAVGDFQLSDDFGLQATLGAATEMYKGRNILVGGNNLSIPNFYDPSNHTGIPDIGFGLTKQRTAGIFAKAKFNYKQWMYILLTGRQDFTSTLPLNNNSYFYPSYGITFILTDAIPALRDVQFLDLLKISGSNTTVYNSLSPYQVNLVYSQVGGFPLGDINSFRIQGSSIDPNIKKEKVNETEIDLNAAFFNRRFNLTASWFYNVTSNMIITVNPSVTSGSTGFLTNIGQLHNTGYGFNLRGTIIRSNNVQFKLGVNMTHYIQIVDKLNPGTNIFSTGGFTYAVLGEPYPLLRATGFKRTPKGRVVVDRQTGAPVQSDTLITFGRTQPKLTFGINPSFSYKGLRITANMSYRTGFSYYEAGLSQMMFTGKNYLSAAANRQPFVYPNSAYDADPDPNVTHYVPNKNIPITLDPRQYFTHLYDANPEHYIRDGSEFKIRRVAIMYTLPSKVLSKTNAIKSLTLGVYARNLLIITPNDQTRYTDPEFGGGNGLPPTRNYGFTVNIQF